VIADLGELLSAEQMTLQATLVSRRVMNLRVIALVTAAISAERPVPMGERVAQTIGIVVVAVGLLLIARVATGLDKKLALFVFGTLSMVSRRPESHKRQRDDRAAGD
jgi:hypothetical protein